MSSGNDWRSCMASKKMTSHLRIVYDPETEKMLKEIARRRFEGNISLAVRQLIREAYNSGIARK